MVEDCPEELLFGNPYIEKLGILTYMWDRAAYLSVFDRRQKKGEAEAGKKKEEQRILEKLALAEQKEKERKEKLLLRVEVPSVGSSVVGVGHS